MSKIKTLYYWLNVVRKFRSFLQVAKKDMQNPEDNLSRKIGVIVQPWLGTPAPFFSFALAVFLFNRGNEVSLIIDDLYFGESKLTFDIQIFSIKALAFLRPKKIKLIILSKLPQKFDTNILTDEYLKNLSTQNIVHNMKGELVSEKRKEKINRVYTQLQIAKPHIYSLFLQYNFEILNVSGGIYGTTGLYVKYAKHFNVSCGTFDSGYGVLVASVNGVSAQLSDIPLAVDMLYKSISDDEKTFVKESALKLIMERKAGTDVFAFLNAGIDSEINSNDVGVLILLNSIWDSASLGIYHLYHGYNEWLVSTIDFLLNNSNTHITVRQHPGEKLDYQRPADDLKRYLKDRFSDSERITFIDCEAKVNTYMLIEKAKYIVCFSSTTGIEAAILGKKVVVCSNCYYSNQSFVYKAVSLQSYHQLLIDSLSEDFKPTPTNQEQAIFFYYLGQCCNWVFTDFTPMPEDYFKWISIPYDELYKSEAVQLYLQSIETIVPISYLISRSKVAAI